MRACAALADRWALFCAAPAQAHTRSQSRSNWTIAGDALEARIEADAVEVTRFYALGGDAPMEALFAGEVSRSFQVSAAGAACAPSGAADRRLGPGRTRAGALAHLCPAGALARGPIEIESALFLSVAPSHLHFLSLRGADGETAEAVLTRPNPKPRSIRAPPGRRNPSGACLYNFCRSARRMFGAGLTT